jgi:hypothetical protein
VLHEPQHEKLIKKELMAKAEGFSEIVFTSLKAGANFKKENKTNPNFQVGDQNNDRETRLIHARSKKSDCCMSRKLIG